MTDVSPDPAVDPNAQEAPLDEQPLSTDEDVDAVLEDHGESTDEPFFLEFVYPDWWVMGRKEDGSPRREFNAGRSAEDAQTALGRYVMSRAQR